MTDEEFNPRRRKKGQKREKVSMEELIRRKREAENIKVETGNPDSADVPTSEPGNQSVHRENREESSLDVFPERPVESRQLMMSETPPPLPMARKASRPDNKRVSITRPDLEKTRTNNEQRRKSHYEPQKEIVEPSRPNVDNRRKSYAIPRESYNQAGQRNNRRSEMSDRKSVLSDRKSLMSDRLSVLSNNSPEINNDWQEDRTLAESNEYMLMNEIGCDVTFLVGPNEEVVAAHSYILISRSAQFYRLLSQQMNQLNKVIVIPDVNTDSFRHLLRYMYTDEFQFNVQDSMSLLPIADKYGGTNIKQKCFKYLLSEMSSENVCSTLELAHEFREQIVYDKCIHFILVNADDTLNAHGFRHLCRECVEKIVDSDDLNAEELSVFSGVSAWATAECSRRKLQPNDKHRRDVLGKLLYCVRYSTMGVHEFTHKLSQNEILSAEEKIALYQFFHGKTQMLPSHLQKRSRRKRVVRQEVIDGDFQMSGNNMSLGRHDFNNQYPSLTNGKLIRDSQRVLRFNGIAGTWRNKGPDAITFRSSESIVLSGIQIFGPPTGTEYYEVNLVIFDDFRNTVRKQDTTITTGSSKVYDVMLNDPVLVPVLTCFTVQTIINGAPSIRGTDGLKFVSAEGVEFEFMSSCKSLNGTDETTGQIPALLFSKP